MTPQDIVTLRTSLNLSQRAFADRLNQIDPTLRMSASSISRYETDQRTPAPHIQGAIQVIALEAGQSVPPLTHDQPVPANAEAIAEWEQVIATCDAAIASGGNGDFSPATAQAIRRLALVTLANLRGQ